MKRVNVLSLLTPAVTIDRSPDFVPPADLQPHLLHEESIVWLVDPSKLSRWVRSLVINVNTPKGPISKFKTITLGWSELSADAPASRNGIVQRRLFWLYESDLEFTGYGWGVGGQHGDAIDPLSVRPGVAGTIVENPTNRNPSDAPPLRFKINASKVDGKMYRWLEAEPQNKATVG